MYKRQVQVIPGPGGKATVAAGEVRAVARRAAEAWNAMWSVSYTHLRAHETVLDLVCRLLLEKKKTNITLTQHYSTRQ